MRQARRGRASALAASGLFAGALTASALQIGCTSEESRVNMTVERYLSSVVQRNDEGIATIWAPFCRELLGLPAEEYQKKLKELEPRILQSHHLFDKAKEDGEIPPDPLGLAMFRALGMGKGAVSFPLSTRIEEGGATAHVRTRIVTNLETIHLDAIPDGTRIYLMGYPVGKLETIAVGYEDLSQHHLLEAVDIDWTLSRAPAGAPYSSGWLIESIVPDPNSSVEWKPKGKKG
jgi:hypothetical protein